MLYSDSHCDTITFCQDNKTCIHNGNSHINFEKLFSNNAWLQFFAVFIYDKHNKLLKCDDYLAYIKEFTNTAAELENLHIVDKSSILPTEWSTINNSGYALIAVEGLNIENVSAADVEALYDNDVRSICLTWNYDNEIACGNLTLNDKGLSEKGRGLVGKMFEKKLLVDISHASYRTFFDVVEIAKQYDSPIMASHSNSDFICKHTRNLTDEQILEIGKLNGYIGINFYPVFLSNNSSAHMDDIIKHIEHICGLIGYKNLGLGADFDGVDSLPVGISGYEHLYTISNRLGQINYSDEQIKNIMGVNLFNYTKCNIF